MFASLFSPAQNCRTAQGSLRKAQLAGRKLIAGRDMTSARGGQTATVLPDIKVLIAGGKQEHGNRAGHDRDLRSRPRKHSRRPQRCWFRARGTLPLCCADGKILIAGGATRGGVPLASCEDYDFEAEKFTRPRKHALAARPCRAVRAARWPDTAYRWRRWKTGSRVRRNLRRVHRQVDAGRQNDRRPRESHRDAALRWSRADRRRNRQPPCRARDAAEIFDPKTNKFTATAGICTKPAPAIPPLFWPSGKVFWSLVTDRLRKPLLASAEIYKPASDSFSRPGNLPRPLQASAIRRPAGWPNADRGRRGRRTRFTTPNTGSFRTVDGGLDTARYDSAALQLMDGSTRFFGGYDSKGVEHREDLDLSPEGAGLSNPRS